MYFLFDLIEVQLYTIKIWHPCIFSTKIWTSIKSSKKYIFGILKCHISTPCTQFPSQNPSPTYKPFKDTVQSNPESGPARNHPRWPDQKRRAKNCKLSRLERWYRLHNLNNGAIKMLESDTMTSCKVLLERACHCCELCDCREIAIYVSYQSQSRRM